MGEAIADIIQKLHRTGTHPALEAMRKDIPEGVLPMLSIPGLRPDKVLKVHRELGVASLDELEQAARQDRLRAIKGLGPALQRKILQGIEICRQGQGQRHLHRAAELLQAAEENLRNSHLGLKRITPAGDFRRGCELVRDLSLVAETPRLRRPSEALKTGAQLTVHLADPRHYGITLLRATGSQAHLDALQKRAAEKALVFDEEGLRRGRRVVAGASEEQIYSGARSAIYRA